MPECAALYSFAVKTPQFIKKHRIGYLLVDTAFLIIINEGKGNDKIIPMLN